MCVYIYTFFIVVQNMCCIVLQPCELAHQWQPRRRQMWMFGGGGGGGGALIEAI